MTKELTAILILTAVAISSLVGWVFFERSSVLTQVDFSEKSAAPLNPTLNTQVLE
ncbi:MAG: hypothetical protein Q8L46_01370 [candidate division WWE3 bacterium]|nr:hypothetical protein [candidate division WWE3 bacterium]